MDRKWGGKIKDWMLSHFKMYDNNGKPIERVFNLPMTMTSKGECSGPLTPFGPLSSSYGALESMKHLELVQLSHVGMNKGNLHPLVNLLRSEFRDIPLSIREHLADLIEGNDEFSIFVKGDANNTSLMKMIRESRDVKVLNEYLRLKDNEFSDALLDEYRQHRLPSEAAKCYLGEKYNISEKTVEGIVTKWNNEKKAALKELQQKVLKDPKGPVEG